MNKLILLFFLCIALINCDGRNRKHKTNAEVLKEAKLLKSFSEQVNFTPNTPVLIHTDTILNNGFRVKLKYNSIENNYISKKSISKNNSAITNNYKNFEAKFQISKNNKIISEQLINKSFFNEYRPSTFWDNAIMQFIWIDYTTSSSKTIDLKTSFCIPETETCKDFVISINEFGDIKIKETNLIPNSI